MKTFLASVTALVLLLSSLALVAPKGDWLPRREREELFRYHQSKKRWHK